jgi:hypothetical protein
MIAETMSTESIGAISVSALISFGSKYLVSVNIEGEIDCGCHICYFSCYRLIFCSSSVSHIKKRSVPWMAVVHGSVAGGVTNLIMCAINRPHLECCHLHVSLHNHCEISTRERSRRRP